MTTPTNPTLSADELAELCERLRERYTADEVPPCRVCGRPLSIQRAGGGERTIWGCDGWESDPDEPGHNRRAPGYDPSGNHYERSRWEQFRNGDSDVLTLLAERAACEVRLERATKALGPFGLCAAKFKGFNEQDGIAWPGLTVADFRAAAAFLAGGRG